MTTASSLRTAFAIAQQISQNDFFDQCQRLFEAATAEEINEVFFAFDRDNDGVLNHIEYQKFQTNLIQPLLNPKNALIVVDFQNDFISGTLPVKAGPAGQNPLEALPLLNKLLIDRSFDWVTVAYSFDWHPANHISFADNVHLRKLAAGQEPEKAVAFSTVRFEEPVKTLQALWPRHCVQDSWGAQLHQDLIAVPNALKIYKGSNPDVDSNSAFFDNNHRYETELRQKLQTAGITSVFVCGLAYDVCVGATAKDSLESGFKTGVIEDCSKGLDWNGIRQTKQELADLGCVFANSDDVKPLVQGDHILWEWVLFSARQEKNRHTKRPNFLQSILQSCCKCDLG